VNLPHHERILLRLDTIACVELIFTGLLVLPEIA